jgi:CRP/FNR family transcriptional regulator, cyclic AMP receptor protein
LGVDVDGWPSKTLLGRLPEPVADAILRAGAGTEFPAKRTLLQQGEQSYHVLLLLSGKVKVTVHSGGQATLLAIRGRGDTIGEMAALEGDRRMATVVSCQPGKARMIERPLLEKLMLDFPALGRQIATVLSSRLRHADERSVNNNVHDLRVRLCRELAVLMLNHGSEKNSHWELDVPLTQKEFASMIGVSGRAVEQELGRLRAAGVVDWGYRGVRVSHMRRLLDIAYGR